MSSTVKCNTCNIVIDELLAFIQNKLSVCDELTLIKLCVSSFNSEEIKQSKSLLFESVPTTKRKIVRIKQGKESRDLEDIISLFKSADPDVTPTFVAKNLEKLPPLTFDHLDVTKILKDIIILQTELNSVKSKYVTVEHLDEFKLELTKSKHITEESIQGQNNIAATSINSCSSLHNHSNLIDELTSTAISPQKDNIDCHTNKFPPYPNQPISCAASASEAAAAGSLCVSGGGARGVQPRALEIREPDSETSDRQPCNISTVLLPTSLVATEQKEQLDCGSFLTQLSEGNSNLNTVFNDNTNNWTRVSYKKKQKYRYGGQTGTGTESFGFKAAEKKSPIFITNIHLEVLESDIIKYIQLKTNEIVSLHLINTRRQNNHKAYKFFVPDHKVPLFLDNNLWPQGIIFRKFVKYKQGYANRIITNKSN